MNVSDSTLKAFQQANREHLHSIWQRARDGQLDGLSEEEKQIGKIMLDHSEEYFNQFEFADVLADREFNPESEVNPFLHVTLHAIVEKQISDRDPMEAFQFYNAMLHNKCSRHEAIHLLMTIMIRFLFPVLKGRETFDLDGYRKFLRIYKTRKPDKIIALLENEPDSPEIEGVAEEKFQIFDELQSALKGKAFKSIDEAQAFAEMWMKENHAGPVPEFL
ncbi:MAG: DUF1841 family protein [Syntrophaceae bacterium]|nr:DUF1841 family protein [Syntrophaceae bacterium]